jgi:alkanesulfonate monooxygenase
MSTNIALKVQSATPSERGTFRSLLQVFSTCPSSAVTPDHYLERVAQVARWSEQAGCTGILVYTDNSLVDPWLVSQIIIENTSSLCPLVAVQPVYMHPYSVAKMVTSLAFLYGRRVYLNMVAGGFKNDLTALNDTTPHDSRYQRLVEYTLIVRQLLEGRSPVTFEGQFYRVKGLTLNPRVAPEFLPGILVSGSSDAGLVAARAMGAIAVKYPEPPDRCQTDRSQENSPCGVRIGIIAREQEDEAWKIAVERFPED